MRKLADFGLEKIPTEALLSMARQENGKLQAYITELEDKLEATQIELKSLKAYMESDIYSISASERKRENKEFRKDQYVRNLIEQTNLRIKNAKRRDQQIKDMQYYLIRRIDQLEMTLKDNGIALPDASSKTIEAYNEVATSGCSDNPDQLNT